MSEPRSEKSVVWKSGETIYKAGDKANGAFIILSGKVDIFTKEGLKLNQIGEREIFGESSTILNAERSVTAKAAGFEVRAIHINTQNLKKLIKNNIALGAIIHKTQLRLIDSNNQSQELSSILDSILSKVNETGKIAEDLHSLVLMAKEKVKKLNFSEKD